MMLEVIEKKLSDEAKWDEFVDNSIGGTIFHKSWYLRIYGVKRLLLVCVKSEILCGMPLYENDQNPEVLIQSTKVVPYSGMIFSKKYNDCSVYYKVMKKRKLINKMCTYLKEKYSDVSFAMSVENKDIVEFIRMGFFPEVRYTLINDVAISDEERRKCYISQRRYYIKKAQKKGISIKYGIPFEKIDLKKLTFWIGDDIQLLHIYSQIVQHAIQNSCGIPIVAFSEEGNMVGMLVLVWDTKKAYTILSFYDEKYSSFGIGTLLYDSALSYACNYLPIKYLDFEGSVLSGVEDFFLSFAGKQSIYFNMHWSKNVERINFQGMYKYE